MPIDKRMIPAAEGIDIEPGLEVEIAVEDEDLIGGASEEYDGEGGVVVDFAPQETATEELAAEHDANIALHMSDDDLDVVAADLIQNYKDDRLTRKPWEEAYSKGLSLLGLQIEDRTSPWAGASGVFHPILTEAVIKFQADAMMETFPARGPVLTRIVGKETPEKVKQAKRVQHDMNYQCTEVMTECRAEHEQALFYLAISGSIFKKVYYDHQLGRQSDRFVPADDFVVAYGTTDLKSCPRATHVIRMFSDDLKKAQKFGQYRDVAIQKPTVQYTNTEQKEDKVSGVAPAAEKDDRHTILEMHVNYDLKGFEDRNPSEDGEETGEETGIGLPFIITIEEHSSKVLSIYRNWEEGDSLKVKLENFVHYLYIPGLGFYGIGLVHLLGSIAKAGTSILRQLIDAGTLANLPAGLKARGLRIKGDNTPLSPGEFRDVDVPGGTIKDSIAFVPYKEPSATLFNLLGALIEEGRNIASIADLKISEMNGDAPVGTTLAILERGMKVMSSIHARIHAAMHKEFKLVAKLVRAYSPEKYEYEVDEGATRAKDYDERIDIIPVSNPNASTLSQRIMQSQAMIQLSSQAPEIYNKKLLHRNMITAMGVDSADKIIPMGEDMKPMDPVAENQALLTGKPVKAFDYQDHESHIKVHLNAVEDPRMKELIGKSPSAPAIMGAAAAHIQEHVGWAYRRGIEKELGVPMPETKDGLPPEVEVQLSKLVADASDKLLKRDIAEQQAMKNAAAEKDPVLKIQLAEAQTKRDEVQRKGMADKMRAFLGIKQIESKEKLSGMDKGVEIQNSFADKQLELQRLQIELERIKSQERQAGSRLGVDIATSLEDDKIERERIVSQEKQTGLREGINIAKSLQQHSEKETDQLLALAKEFIATAEAERDRSASNGDNKQN